MVALAAAAFSVTALCWTCEMFKDRDVAIVDFFVLLCLRHFGARPNEMHEVNGITWYVTGLAATSLIGFFVGPEPCIVGVLTLGFGDPAAAWFGRRFGRVRLPNGKSAEGFVAFVLASVSVNWVFLSSLRRGAVSFPGIVLGSLSGAVAEVVCPGEQSLLNDNVLIPVVASVMCALL
jgi:dolichol kinase